MSMSNRAALVVSFILSFCLLCGTVPAVHAQQGESEGENGEKLVNYANQLKQTLTELNDLMTELASQADANTRELEELQGRMDNLESSFDEVMKTVEKQTDFVESLKGIEQYKNKILEMARDLSALSRKVEDNNSTVKKVDNEIKELQSNYGTLEKVVAQNQKGVSQLQSDTDNLDTRLNDLKKEMQATAQRNLLVGAAGAVLAAFAIILSRS